MIGWFSLNVPAGLGVYWVINNGLSTLQQWYIRQQFKDVATEGAGGMTAPMSFQDEIRQSSARVVEPPKFKITPTKKAEAVKKVAENSEDDDEHDSEGSQMSKAQEKKQKKARDKKKKSD